MRLLLVVEATPAALLAVAGRQAEVRELVVNEWVQLVSVHPVTGAMMRFEGGTFVPYEPATAGVARVQRSADWHGGTRAHVASALVADALPRPVTPDRAPGAPAEPSVA
jgi:hypothetical protein